MEFVPGWLTALQQVRERRRDAAARELANRQETLRRIEAEQRNVDAVISSLIERQRSEASPGRVHPELLREIWNARRSLAEQQAQLFHHASVAKTALCDAQTELARRHSEVQSLKRLMDRLQAKQAQHLHQESDRAQFESVLTLCNRQRSD